MTQINILKQFTVCSSCHRMQNTHFHVNDSSTCEIFCFLMILSIIQQVHNQCWQGGATAAKAPLPAINTPLASTSEKHLSMLLLANPGHTSGYHLNNPGDTRMWICIWLKPSHLTRVLSHAAKWAGQQPTHKLSKMANVCFTMHDF